MTQEEKDILIAKIICGEASEKEIERSNQLVLSDPGFKSELEKSKLAFIKLKEQPEFDSQTAWLKMKSRINQTPAKKIQLSYIIRNIAAVILLIGIGSLIYFQMQFKSKSISIQTQKEIKKELLPDGSQIIMNQNSSIQYQFSEEKRIIQLKGEAFFEVKHDSSKPFIIEVHDLQITDIGTAFLVSENKDQSTVYIGVEEGIIMIESAENKMELKAGEQAVYDVKSAKLERFLKEQKIRPTYASKVLRFNRTPLYQALQEIENNYQLNIEIGTKSIQNCEITASFTDENPDIILQVICETLHLDMKKTNNQYILTGLGCN